MVPKELIVLNERVLVKPEGERKSHGGIILPANTKEADNIVSGYAVKKGQGYPIHDMKRESKPWEKQKIDRIAPVAFMPLSVAIGDLLFYIDKYAIEVKYKGETYHVVPEPAVVLVIRHDVMDGLGDQ